MTGRAGLLRFLVAPREPQQPAPAPLTPFDRMALTYLARKDRTEAEVRGFLARRGASAAAIDAVLGRLARGGYVNDEAFALRWVRDRVTRRPAGRLKLEQELLTKGLRHETARRAVDRVLENQSERDLAERVLAQRFAEGKPRSPGRVIAALRRHGFEPEVIEALCDRMGITPAEDGPGEGNRL